MIPNLAQKKTPMRDWNGKCDMQQVGEIVDGRTTKRCTWCGLTLRNVKAHLNVHSQCTVGPEKGKPVKPTLLKTYARAVAKWLDAGRPKRTDEQVDAIMDICGSCQFYKGGGCQRCGCRVNRNRNALTNKIRMATENCPIKKW